MGELFEIGLFILLPTICACAFYYLIKNTKFAKLSYLAQQGIIGLCFFAIAGYSTLHNAYPVRDAAVATAGLLFGAPSGIIAAVLSSVVCLYSQVNPYISLAGAINVLVLGFGSALLRKYMFDDKKPAWPYSLASGIVSEILFLLLAFMTHMSEVHQTFAYVSNNALPIILVNGIAAMLPSMVIAKLSGEKLFHRYKNKQISVMFQRWLLICVGISLIATSIFTILLQSSTAWGEVNEVLSLNLADIKKDISDLSDDNLLSIAQNVGDHIERISEGTSYREAINDEVLEQLAVEFNASEINLINEKGIIISSTYPLFIGFDMRNGEQSNEFVESILNNNEKSYVQSYQPTASDPKLGRKYAAVALEKGGFIQVGYNSESFHENIDHVIQLVVRNRHVSQSGGIFIFNEDLEVVSGDIYELSTPDADTSSIQIEMGKVFQYDVLGVPSYCMIEEAEGYYVIAYIPVEEANFDRNFSLYIMIFMEILIFVGLFIRIYFLIKGVVVDNIQEVTKSLSQISDGNLDTAVDVRASDEFASLSDDINSTVDTLKSYIAAAAARIDKELEFARVIQNSVLPSVFPDNHPNIEIFANMNAAKEVGGDFYDFYFIDSHTIVFLIADVSGKGIPAAMFMMQAKALIKGYAESGMEVDEILNLTNEKLCEGNDAEMFVTVWIGKLDIYTGELSFASAGHNPPLLLGESGKYDYLKSKVGFVLAGMEGVRYKKNTVTLLPGEQIYLYTDGVTEATTADNRLYGEERLQNKLNEDITRSPSEIIQVVKDDINVFVEDAPQFDDITMLCVKFIQKKDVE